MDQHQRIIFESSPAFVIVCVLVGLAYAAVLYYKVRHPWSRILNRLLFIGRAILVSFLCFLLLGPIVRQIHNILEAPLYVFVQDNSASVAEAVDSVTRKRVEIGMQESKRVLEDHGYEVVVHDLEGHDAETFRFDGATSDLQGGLRKVANQFEGRNIAGVVLVSDGIYNAGMSPAYAAYSFPVYTLGLGDTTQRTDAAIRNLTYNKIAYQGNKFPLRVEVSVSNLDNQPITVTLQQRGKTLDTQTKNAGKEHLLTFDFLPLAAEKGIQKLDIQVDVKPGEHNVRNNRGSVFVEVVEGKKKIVVIAPAPHPDIKALREVVEKNSNYELLLHIPRVEELQPAALQPESIDLVIFHQAPDMAGRTRELFQKFVQSKTSLWFILGAQSDLMAITRAKMPLQVAAPPRDWDEVTPSINAAFSNFSISAEANSIIPEYPPVAVHFGKIQIPAGVTPLLFQRVGSIVTEKPLMALDTREGRKIAIMLGDGFWRWRLNEFDRTEATLAFDELFGKLIQYLGTTDDRRKFRSYPTQQEFSDTEPAVIESQVYNDIYEPVYGNTIDVEVTSEGGTRKQYSYTTSPGNVRYSIGGLKEGVYRYRSRTVLNGETEEIRGEFAVVQRQAELQNLTADFDLLRKLSAATGGRFFEASDIETLNQELSKKEASSVIHTEETYNGLITLKWVFWALLLLVSLEWFLRKYFGSY